MPVRKTASPREIKLHANGLTFSALEMGEGPLVLCLHGFPDHYRSYREQMPVLAAAGYRVVAPMNRGYEPSAIPEDGNYHINRMASDVVGWLDDLGVERAHLLGHDWGAVIGYATAAHAPRRVRSLMTMAVPHLRRMPRGLWKVPEQVRNSWYMGFFQLPLVSDVKVEKNDYAFIERLWRDWSPGWEWPAEEMTALKATFRRPGVLQGALGYYRAFFRPWQKDGRATFKLLTRKLEVPTLALTGASDGCMDTRLYDEIMRIDDFPAGLRVARIQGAGHFLHQEQPAEVNRVLLHWLD